MAESIKCSPTASIRKWSPNQRCPPLLLVATVGPWTRRPSQQQPCCGQWVPTGWTWAECAKQSWTPRIALSCSCALHTDCFVCDACTRDWSAFGMVFMGMDVILKGRRSVGAGPSIFVIMIFVSCLLRFCLFPKVDLSSFPMQPSFLWQLCTIPPYPPSDPFLSKFLIPSSKIDLFV